MDGLHLLINNWKQRKYFYYVKIFYLLYYLIYYSLDGLDRYL